MQQHGFGVAAQPAAQPQSALSGEGMTPASPEEQALYDHFVSRALTLVYDPKMSKTILQQLEDEDPIEGLARATAGVVKRTYDAAKAAGQDVPGDIVLNGGVEIFAEVADYGREAGIEGLQDILENKQKQEAAAVRAADHVRLMMTADGSLDQGAAMQDLEALVQADRAGELDKVLGVKQ